MLNGYDLVIHVIDKDSVKAEDDRIQEIWSRIPQYHQIIVNEADTRENFNIALNKIMDFLARAKEPPILNS